MENANGFYEQIKKGDLEGVQAGIARNPDLLNETNETGQSPFLVAKYYRQEKIAEYLLGLNPKLDLFNATVAGRIPEVVSFIERDPALLNACSSDGWTPLHLAAFFGKAELANVLLDRGADIEARSKNAMKNTPLHAAAAGGHIELVDLLLKRGADVNATQEGGWTALHSAAQADHRKMAETLIAHGADINARAANQQSPLDLALSHGNQEIAALLDGVGAKLK